MGTGRAAILGLSGSDAYNLDADCDGEGYEPRPTLLILDGAPGTRKALDGSIVPFLPCSEPATVPTMRTVSDGNKLLNS